MLEDLPEAFHRKVQVLIEERLIVGGNRVPLPELVILQQEQIPQDVVNKLLDSHILRAERNSTGGRSIELSHDTLIAPVTEAYKKRTASEKVQAEQKRVEAVAKQRQEELEAARREAEEERQRAEAQAELRQVAERAKDKAKTFLWIAAIVAVVAIVVAIFAYKSYRTAETLKKVSDQMVITVKMQSAITYAETKKGYAESYETTKQWDVANQNFKLGLDSLKRFDSLNPKIEETTFSKDFKQLKDELETKLARNPQR